MTNILQSAAGEAQHSRPRFLLRCADFFGNMWFGVTVLTLVLVYCWVGSAGTYPFEWFPRQTFEKTEMEWFTWWPFLVLVGLLCLSLCSATLRRIPLDLPNLGTWSAHLGILVLVLGSGIYYSQKLEGDIAVYRRQAVVQVDGGQPTSLVLRPGEQAVVQGEKRAYRVRVANLQPNYELLTGEDKGKRTYAAQLEFTPLGDDGRSFVRQLLVGYPQYTEDVVPGQGRAIKALGRRLVDEAVVARLEYAPTDLLTLHDRPAIYVRRDGDESWVQYPVEGLPRYHDYVAAPGDAVVAQGEPAPRTGRLSVDLRAKEAGLTGVDLRILGFLPFAHMQQRWVPGGDHFDPYLRFTLSAGGAEMSDFMLANDPQRSRLSIDEGLLAVSFKWVSDPESLEALIRPTGVPRLRVTVKDRGVSQDVPLDRAAEGPVAIAGTGYQVQLAQLYSNWTLASSSEPAQMAVVRVERGGQSFLRAVVAPRVELSQDLTDSGHMRGGLVDEKIRIELLDLLETGIIIVGGTEGLHVVVVGQDGQVHHQQASVGRAVPLFDGQMQLLIHELSANSQKVRVPVVIPRAERDQKAGSFYSMVQLELREGQATRRVWLDYSNYPHPSRTGYYPRVLRLADGRRIELLYSRESLRLGTPIALEDFRLEVFPGGTRERDYISRIRFFEDGQWSEIHEVRSNQPTEHDGWWLFQATWDPPAPERNYAGMNYTGLGVGNRHGVGVMLFGSLLTVFGALWAFYFKPVLLLRRREEGRHAAGRRAAGVPAVLMLLVVGAGLPAVRAADLSVARSFQESVDLDAFRAAAAQEGGRVKTIDSLAREKLKYVNSRLVAKVDPVIWYLDMVLIPEHYVEAPVIRIKNKALRQRLAQGVRSVVPAAEREGLIADPVLAQMVDDGLVSIRFLDHPAVRSVLGQLEADLRQTGKAVNQVRNARALADSRVLRSLLRVVPPPGGGQIDPWFTLDAAISGGAPADSVHAGMVGGGVPGLDPALAGRLGEAWSRLEKSWRFQDAEQASAALVELAEGLRSVNPALYPDDARLGWELWYYKHNKLTAGWLIYFFAIPLLLMAFLYGFRWARVAGLGLFFIAFVVHSFSIFLRWWLAGRIPNANMFEAVIASAWFGGVVALLLEWVLRRQRLRLLPALCASAYAMVAMMFGNFMTVTLSSDITTVMPVLDRTIWLYIHTNVIIASYALIFFASVTAVLYLVFRGLHRLAPKLLGEQWGPRVFARGGASSVILGRQRLDEDNAGLARTLDGATMVFLEVAFVTLWVGTVLGAVWADVSWGRPWGWDPKEVFALNTWLVFLVLLHVRIKVRDKALWTAILAVIGCAVMIFNWVAVNFVIVGLHSYA